VDYWGYVSGISGETKQHYNETWDHFEEVTDGNISVNFTSILDAGRTQKLTSAVEAENAPDACECGAIGIEFYNSGAASDMTKYMSESKYPDQFVTAAREVAAYRDNWWSGGNKGPQPTLLSLSPDLFKEAGAESPDDLSTWSDFRGYLDTIQENNPNVVPFQEAAQEGDFESAWGYARTAYTDGEDPYLDVQDQGSYDDPYVKIGQEDPTDGMMKHTVDMARTYSQDAGLGNLDVPALMLSDRVAASWGSGSAPTYTAVDENVELGWDGDAMELAFPKVTPELAETSGISELEGIEGQHGGHAWGLSTSTQTYASSDVKDAAWRVQEYDNFNERHIVKMWSEFHHHVAATTPLNEAVLEAFEKKGGAPQPMEEAVRVLDEYDGQVMTTGATWDIPPVNSIRVDAIQDTMRSAIAGDLDIDEVPKTAREETLRFIEEI
jgi:hypothetical protein